MKAVTEIHDDLLVDIEVSPNARKFEITGYNSWRDKIEIRIKSLPQKGKANKEIVKEFSKLLGREVELVSGLKSQQKTIKIYNMHTKEFLKIIKPILK